MNKKELYLKLLELEISENLFCLEGGSPNEQFVLNENFKNNHWEFLLFRKSN